MKKTKIYSALLAALLLTPPALQAHHSFAMFDHDREELIEGTVVRWAFNSPHIALYIENPAGTLYSLEGAAPPSLISRTPSMNGFTFQPGQHVKVVYCPLKDGRSGGAIGFIIDDADVFYQPNDGGCGPSQKWKEWVGMGYKTRAEAEKNE